jgi:hypothetical protein
MNLKQFFLLQGVPLLSTLVSCTTVSRQPAYRQDEWHIEQAPKSKKEPLPWVRIQTEDESKGPSLVGRWQSDVKPSGFWVIDRYADGRFVKKSYEAKGKPSPHHIGLTWGRWRKDKMGYHHILDGTNLPDYIRFVGKWRVWPILSLEHNHFAFRVNDGDRGELRISSAEPLPLLKMPRPTRSIYGWHPAENGIIEQNLTSVPKWVKQRRPDPHPISDFNSR